MARSRDRRSTDSRVMDERPSINPQCVESCWPIKRGTGGGETKKKRREENKLRIFMHLGGETTAAHYYDVSIYFNDGGLSIGAPSLLEVCDHH